MSKYCIRKIVLMFKVKEIIKIVGHVSNEFILLAYENNKKKTHKVASSFGGDIVPNFMEFLVLIGAPVIILHFLFLHCKTLYYCLRKKKD